MPSRPADYMVDCLLLADLAHPVVLCKLSKGAMLLSPENLPGLLTSSIGDTRKLNSRNATSAGLSLVNPKLSYSPGALRTAANKTKLQNMMNWPRVKLMGVWPSFQ